MEQLTKLSAGQEKMSPSQNEMDNSIGAIQDKMNYSKEN
jgi:hypothetical protein